MQKGRAAPMENLQVKMVYVKKGKGRGNEEVMVQEKALSIHRKYIETNINSVDY
jgi:hypothetical protein